MRTLCIASLLIAALPIAAQEAPAERTKDAYVRAVTRGAGLMPWQSAETSEAERTFRAEVEARKEAMLANSGAVAHPVLYTPEDIARAKANGESDERAQRWIDNQIGLADEIAAKDAAWVEAMLPMEAPSHAYGFTCPACVGAKSQEAVGHSLVDWSYTEPDVIACRACGQRYPDAAYPETAELVLPRTGHRIAYYLNDAERAAPDDRSGALAWHWVGYPIHVSFSGMIRERKIGFMDTAARALAFAYAFTGETRYAAQAKAILVRYAQCYRQWPYRDYWDGYADCDPLYAAWHDGAMPIEWKRHLSEQAYAKDELDKAAMMQNYWGAGRVHPSTDAVSALPGLALAYDLTAAAPVWTDADRRVVERDLLLEYIIGAEPFVGGPGQADNANNKAPRVYNAMAAIAQCLGIPEYADTALRGYERVRDESFNGDGMCTESPSYNDMYLSQLLLVPETLHGFVWPEGFAGREGAVDYYASDAKLRLMYRAVLWTLLADGSYLPLSDTHIGTTPSDHIVHMGLKRYPDFYTGTLPALKAERLTEYALFNLPLEALTADTGLDVPETLFPDWQTAILRHGEDALTLAFNPMGGHRHRDNLALYYHGAGAHAVGDLGYVGDMPLNEWIRSALSHCLVVVDDGEQKFAGRAPSLRMMATTPLASVVEAESDAYEQCGEYRRRVAMIKTADGTFAVDIFRVEGGSKHAFRVYSEIAASDSPGGALSFDGVVLDEEPPLPQVGASLDRDDIFGLRDIRAAAPAGDWSATWRDDSAAYRLHVLSPADRVEASNGPGQRSREESGRRVRVVDAVREGADLASAFVAVHEPGAARIVRIERLDAPQAGAEAVALRIDTADERYWVFSDFADMAEVDGIAFQGAFAVFRGRGDAVDAFMSVAATATRVPGRGEFDGEASVAGEVVTQNPRSFTTALDGSPGNLAFDEHAQAYVRVRRGGGEVWTGYPLGNIEGRRITVKDYPLPEIDAYELPAVRYKNWP